jgi:hypothetical protein
MCGVRVTHGISAEMLAADSGVDRAYVSAERGDRKSDRRRTRTYRDRSTGRDRRVVGEPARRGEEPPKPLRGGRRGKEQTNRAR